jgi:DNA-binding NtrC family response regulator
MSGHPSPVDVRRIQAALGQACARLLIVDDDAGRATSLVRVLGGIGTCETAHTLDEALQRLAAGPWDVAIVDFDLGDEGTGYSVLQGLELFSPRTVRILYSSFYSRGFAIEAARTAHATVALDARRPDFASELRSTVTRLLGARADEGDREERGDVTDGWCARAAVTLAMLEQLERAAADDAVVVVHGEPGCGKHLAAATLQRARARRGLPATDPRGSSARRPVRAIQVPPLRERREDLPELCRRLMAGMVGAAQLDPAALDVLTTRDWWGNVRELQSVLARACRHARGRSRIEVGDLPGDVVPPLPDLQRHKDEATRRLVLDYLVFAGSVNAAARHAGVSPNNFRRLMTRFGVLRADTPKEHE